MVDSVRQSEESGLRARLKEVVKEISIIIDNGSEDELKSLLSLLETPGFLALLRGWNQEERRKDPRKPASNAITCSTEDGPFKGFIRDISNGGVFIETPRTFSIGQQVTLIFSPAAQDGPLSIDQEGPIKITGKILWRVPRGIGVKFQTASDDLAEILKSL